MAGLIDIWRNWCDRREALRYLRLEKADAREWAYFRFNDAMTEALSALERADRRHATRVWTEALERYPGQALGSARALDVLIGLERFDEADALMTEGQRKSPGDQRFAIGSAAVARARGDYELAAKRWAMVRKRDPNVMQAYAFGVEALRGLRRLPEAEALTQQTIARFPEEVLGYMEYARLASLQQDWEQAFQRWGVVLTRFDHLSGYIEVAQAMVRFGRYDEADALLLKARIRYPTEPSPDIGLGRSAEAKGDIPEAVVRWERVAQRFPLQFVAVFIAAGALENLGATESAEEVLRAAVDHFPDETRPLIELGSFLLRSHDPEGAVEAFATLRGIFPDEPASYIRGVEALTQAGRLEEAEALSKTHRSRFN
jgi:tetratricopeptide (TPR) repeat protein